jgi:aryl-alcohol dehydrogenase-like predicted oxidoreductase
MEHRIEQRALGQGGLQVSAMGLGCMGMSEFYGPADEAESMATLAAAYDAGITLFDTADSYGLGHNEELLGRFLKGRRSGITVATKFGLVRSAGSYARRIDNSPAYIRAACEASLRRLGSDTIDLYYMHRINHETPLEESMGELVRLVQEGKIRAIGLCEVSAATLRRAAAIHPIAAVQSEYSLWTRDPEIAGADANANADAPAESVLDACAATGATFVAYSPLGRGFLTGAITDPGKLASDDFRSFNPRFSADNWQANVRIADTVKQMAAEKGCTPAQLALAWLLAQPGGVVPIPGTRRVARLRENLGALALRLSTDELERIGAALPPGVAAGARYSEEGMKGLNA